MDGTSTPAQVRGGGEFPEWAPWGYSKSGENPEWILQEKSDHCRPRGWPSRPDFKVIAKWNAIHRREEVANGSKRKKICSASWCQSKPKFTQQRAHSVKTGRIWIQLLFLSRGGGGVYNPDVRVNLNNIFKASLAIFVNILNVHTPWPSNSSSKNFSYKNACASSQIHVYNDVHMTAFEAGKTGDTKHPP